MLDRLRRLITFDDWANRETLASLQAAGEQPLHSLRVLGHIIAAEKLWLSRLQQDGRAVVVWPELMLEECEEELTTLRHQWENYLDELSPDDLSRQILYVNSLGESWANSIEDIMMHVVIHSGYHRGQIASALRAAGHEPAYTDFIHAARQGFLE